MGKPLNESYEGNCIQKIADSHSGEDIFVIGTGTSLTGFPWKKMNDKITIGLNDAVKADGFLPTYHMFSDVNIWKRYSHMVWKPPCKMVCQRHARRMFIDSRSCQYKPYVWQFDISCKPEFDKSDQRLHVRRTVATGGINFAYKLGAERIFLLGVDGYCLKRQYYHDGSVKPPEKRKTKVEKDVKTGSELFIQDRHDSWRHDMGQLEAALKEENLYQGPWPKSGVYNLSPLSTILNFEKVDPEEVLGFSW